MRVDGDSSFSFLDFKVPSKRASSSFMGFLCVVTGDIFPF